MRYPTIVNYTDALRNLKQTFRTLKNVIVETDELGDPVYRASSRSVRFNVKIDGTPHALRMFTGRVGVTTDVNCQRLPGEVLVATDNGADYYDVVIESPIDIHKNESNPTIEIYENRAKLCRNDLFGYTDAVGRVVIEPTYDYVEDFSEGRAVVGRQSMFGLIDADGNEIIPIIYDEISYDGSHLCYTDRQGAWGVMDRSGRTISDNQWDWVGEFSDGMLLVELGGRYGFLNEQGGVAIEIKYDDATSFDANGYADVTLDGRTYKIDKEEFRV